MNKLLIALCAVAFSATAFAQGTTPAAPMKSETPMKAEAPMKAAAPMKAETPMKAEAPKSAMADAGKPTVKKTTHKTKKKAHTAKPMAADGMAPAPMKDKVK